MLKKNLLSAFLFLSFVVVMGFLYSFTTNAISNYTETQPKWQNLKVLPQDISKDSLSHLMKVYAKSLGVNCSYCHAPSKENPEKLDFADESKTAKHIARGMISMTDDINEKYFKPHYPDPKPHQAMDVSCVMCHRGTAKPKQYLENIGSMFPTIELEKK